MIRNIFLTVLMLFLSSSAFAVCNYDNKHEISYIGNAYAAVEAIASALEECPNVTTELNKDYQEKLVEGVRANPALYQVFMVTQSGIVPLLANGSIRPLDDLVAKYAPDLDVNRLYKVDGKIMAIASAVNNQHFFYRSDIFKDLGILPPKTYDDVLAAAEKIKAANVVDYPLAGTYKTGWNLAEEFVNMYLGHQVDFFTDGNMPSINNDAGVASLEMMKKLTAYMDPEYLVSDSTHAQKQFQQKKVAMGNLWATRAAAMDKEGESEVIGLVEFSAAPLSKKGGISASSSWWGGFAIAANIPDDHAEAAFRVGLEGYDSEMAKGSCKVSIWLIEGCDIDRYSSGALATVDQGISPYPASKPMGIMHTELGKGIPDYLNGKITVQQALENIEAAYIIGAKEAGLVN